MMQSSSFQLRTSASLAIKLKSGKQISPVVFYGSPNGAPVKRPSQLLWLLREIRVDLREQNNLLARYVAKVYFRIEP